MGEFAWCAQHHKEDQCSWKVVNKAGEYTEMS